MKEKKILITGANGTIGQVLQAGLQNYHVTTVNFPHNDLRKYESLSEIMSGHSAIIHLAWDYTKDTFDTGTYSDDNMRMFCNVYQFATARKVPRIIMASSVHADTFDNWKGPGYLSPNRIPDPKSVYGVNKVWMETMGRFVATKGVDVVCVRFGAVRIDDTAHPDSEQERAVFLSRADCVSLIDAVLVAETIPGDFALIYGVSDNARRIHDLTNPFHWFPKDKAEGHLG